MTVAGRKAILFAAREAALTGQHALARALFSQVGISYVVLG